jgi:hypothetical protein
MFVKTESVPDHVTEVRKLIGERVRTSDGTGILVSLEIPYNGLYMRPELIKLTVWYPPDSGCHLSSWTYRPEEIQPA